MCRLPVPPEVQKDGLGRPRRELVERGSRQISLPRHLQTSLTIGAIDTGKGNLKNIGHIRQVLAERGSRQIPLARHYQTNMVIGGTEELVSDASAKSFFYPAEQRQPLTQPSVTVSGIPARTPEARTVVAATKVIIPETLHEPGLVSQMPAPIVSSGEAIAAVKETPTASQTGTREDVGRRLHSSGPREAGLGDLVFGGKKLKHPPESNNVLDKSRKTELKLESSFYPTNVNKHALVRWAIASTDGPLGHRRRPLHQNRAQDPPARQ